jgi:hypothetical protein
MSDYERDRRSAGQWLRAVRAYCEWQSGDSWRRGSDRNSPERWWYINGIRCLNEIGEELTLRDEITPICVRKTPVDIQIETLANCSSSSALVEELMLLRPELSARRTLMHLARTKLARMLLDARNMAAADLRRTA